MNDLIENLNWRYATKVFDSTKKIPEGKVNTLAESLRLSASSFGLQPWKFIFVSDEMVKKDLFTYSWNQSQVLNCSHHVVFCYQENFDDNDVERFLKSTADQRSISLEGLESYGKMMKGFLSQKNKEQKQQWMKEQIYIALGSFLVTCSQMKIDACPMEGIIQEKYDEVLGLDKKGWRSAVACSVGYRSSDDKYSDLAKVRYPLNEVIDFC